VSATPLHLLELEVRPEWIDYNGHMNMAYYLVAFDKGADVLFDTLGVGQDYRRRTDHSMYMLESHVIYGRETKLGDRLAVSAQLIDADDKRLHVFMRMTLAASGEQAATLESILLHVAMAGPRAAKFPEAAMAKIAALRDQHRALPAPPEAGRRIGMKR
jgi:acyl-CoA thioester hydrolase